MKKYRSCLHWLSLLAHEVLAGGLFHILQVGWKCLTPNLEDAQDGGFLPNPTLQEMLDSDRFATVGMESHNSKQHFGTEKARPKETPCAEAS